MSNLAFAKTGSLDHFGRLLPPGVINEFFGGGKTATTTQSVQIPPEVLARYNSVNATAQQVAQTPFQQYSTDPNAFVAPLNQQQQAGIAGTNAYANAALPGYEAGMAATGMAGPTNVGQLSGRQIGQYMNPFVQSVVNPTAQLLNQQQQAQMSGQTGNAIQQGAFGGDRAGIAAANLAGQQNLAFANAINPLYSQAYNTALQTAQGQQAFNLQQQQANNQLLLQQGAQFGNLGAGMQTAGLQGAQAQLGAGTLGQQTTQAGLSALYNQFLQQQAYPFQTTQFLANIAEGTGALSGSTTTTTQPQSFFSDERLKDDVEDIGRTHDGQKIVKFRYKGEKGPKQIGLIAQDVEKHHPEAVGLAGGYKTVDYDKATEDAASMGGSVIPERAGLGFAAGGHARTGYVPGGLVSPIDYDAIIQAQQSFLPPGQGRQMAGMPGGGKGVVPALASAHPHLMLPSSNAVHQQTPEFQQALNAFDTGEKTIKDFGTAKTAVSDFRNWLNKPGQPTQLPSANGGPSASPNTSQASATPAPAAPAPAAPPPANPTPDASQPASNWQPALDTNQVGSARGGLVRHHYDAGGDIPYGSGDDNSALGQVVDSGENKYKLNQEAAPSSAPPQQQSGLGQIGSAASALGSLAKLPQSISSGLSGLSGLMGGGANAAAGAAGVGADAAAGAATAGASGTADILPFLVALSKGGSVYREHHADGDNVGDNNNPANMPAPDAQKAAAPAQENTEPDWHNYEHTPTGHSQYIKDYMSYRGADPTHALGVAGAEGLYAWGKNNPNAASNVDIDEKGNPYSFGDFQLNTKNGLGVSALKAGIDPSDPTQWGAADKYAMDYMIKNGLGPWNGDKYVKNLSANAPTRVAYADTGTMTDAGPQGGGLGAVGDAFGGIGDWLSSNQNWLIPVAKGLAGMASSNSRYLGSAILQGLGAGAQSYSDQQLRQIDEMKKVMDIGGSFRPVPTEKGLMLYNPMTNQTISPSARSAYMLTLAKASGLPPSMYPLFSAAQTQQESQPPSQQKPSAPKGAPAQSNQPTMKQPTPTATPAAPATPAAQAQIAQAAPVAPQQAAPQQAAAQPGAAQTPSSKPSYDEPSHLSPQLKNERLMPDPSAYANADQNNNPYTLRNMASQLRSIGETQQADDYEKSAQAILSGAATPVDKQGNPIIPPEIQANKINAAYNAKVMENALVANKAFSDELSVTQTELPKEQNLINLLIKANTSGAKFGPSEPVYNDIYKAVSSIPGGQEWIKSNFPDAVTFANMSALAQKAALTEAVSKIQDAKLQRAPNSSLKFFKDVVPTPNMPDGARYELTAQIYAEYLMNQDMINDWNRAKHSYTSVIPSSWKNEWQAQPQHDPNEYVNKAKMSMPFFSGMTDEEKNVHGPKIDSAKARAQLEARQKKGAP